MLYQLSYASPTKPSENIMSALELQAGLFLAKRTFLFKAFANSLPLRSVLRCTLVAFFFFLAICEPFWGDASQFGPSCGCPYTVTMTTSGKRALLAVSILLLLVTVAAAYVFRNRSKTLSLAPAGAPPGLLDLLPGDAPILAYGQDRKSIRLNASQ